MRAVTLAAFGGLITVGATGPGPAAAGDASPSTKVQSIYAADFVATAASGFVMNDAGDVAGRSYIDIGCGPFCLPPQETVVWRGGQRIVLPPLPGYSGTGVTGINNLGWIAGYAGSYDFPRAVAWKPNGNTYQVIDVGTLPGPNMVSAATGIDDLGRVVGSSSPSNLPPAGAFMWTEAGGIVDLAALGYPNETPSTISPGGTVATLSTWYVLGNPGSVVTMPPAPRGFYIGGGIINDAGDQARFLVSTGSQNLIYLFRFHHEGAGTWQMLSNAGTGHLSRAGLGGINSERDVSATVLSTAVIAPGPDGLAKGLAPLLSPAYQGATLGMGGPMNDPGQILAQVMIGRSQRLMKLVGATPCGANCIQIGSLTMTGKFIRDPDAPPDYCTPKASNHVVAKLRVTDELGKALKGVVVKGHFLDDYWLDKAVTGTTNRKGIVKFVHDGVACVGAVAFLVDDAAKAGRSFDRTKGILTSYVLPLPK
jgi:probable HAF family extracellular repeat protein